METPSLTDATLSVRRRLPLSILLPFATTNIPLAALGVSVFVYLAPYLTSHLGVSLTVVATGWFTVRMLDLGVDFGLGVVMDRTRTRLGRYRLWMLIGVPILMLGLYELFMAPKGISLGYLVVWLLVFYVGTSIMGLAQSAWGANLAPHYDERSRLFGVLAGVGALSAVAVLIFPIIAKNLGFTDAQGVQAMGWFSIILAPVTVALAAWRTPETISADHGLSGGARQAGLVAHGPGADGADARSWLDERPLPFLLPAGSRVYPAGIFNPASALHRGRCGRSADHRLDR